MTVLDAMAAMSWLRGEPGAAEVEVLLVGARLTATAVTETVDTMARSFGVDPDEVVADVAGMAGVPPIAVTATLGGAAGVLRARHYHRTRRSVSLADCIAAEAARLLGQPLATSDPHLLALCHQEGIDVVVLPDSQGRRWSPGEG